MQATSPVQNAGTRRARATSRAIITVTLGVACYLATTLPAFAVGVSCGYYSGWHYAGIYTSNTSGRTECAAYDENTEWTGVAGRIKTPGTTTSLTDFRSEHTLALLSAQFSDDAAWMQTGWYTGTVADLAPPVYTCPAGDCVQRNGSYGAYIEMENQVGYSVLDYGTLSASSDHKYMVEYDATSGCWNVRLDDVLKGIADCIEPSGGAMYATTEMLGASASVAVPLPVTYFGDSSTTSSWRMRLKYFSAWETWDTTLSSGVTQDFDERDYVPGYRISSYNTFWYFKAWLQ